MGDRAPALPMSPIRDLPPKALLTVLMSEDWELEARRQPVEFLFFPHLRMCVRRKLDTGAPASPVDALVASQGPDEVWYRGGAG